MGGESERDRKERDKDDEVDINISPSFSTKERTAFFAALKFYDAPQRQCRRL